MADLCVGLLCTVLLVNLHKPVELRLFFRCLALAVCVQTTNSIHSKCYTEGVLKETVTYRDRIVVDPDIMAGKPVVRGTRIPVDLVLKRLSEDFDLDHLFAAYPRLTREDVQACLAYANLVVAGESLYPATLHMQG